MPKRRLFILVIEVTVFVLLALSASADVTADTPQVKKLDRSENKGNWVSTTAQDNSGNVYVTGLSAEILGEGSGYVTTKYDGGGNQVWVARYVDPQKREHLTPTIRLDDSGNAQVRLKDGKSGELTVICYGPDGEVAWTRRHDGSLRGALENVGVLPTPGRASNGPSYEQGWPVILSGGTQRNVAAADIDNDGMVEIVVSEFDPPGFGSGNGHIYVFRHDGTLMEPWPDVDLEPYGLNPRSVSLGDLDNDGDLELVFVGGCRPETEGHTVYIFHHDGTKVTDGWPKPIGSLARSPMLEDIDDDGLLEIIVTDGSDKVSAWNFDGSDVAGWPFVFPGAGPIHHLAVGDLDCDGQKEIVGVQSSLIHQYVYVISSDGQLLHRWYISDGPFGVTAFPSLADLDKDGDLEIVFDGCSMVHAYHHDGIYVTGWPVPADFLYWLEEALSVGDMDRDNLPEVAARAWQDPYSPWPNTSVWRNDGNLQEGWPVSVTDIWIDYPSSIGNIDNDDELEILVTATRCYEYDSSRAEIYAFNWDGTLVDGFPFSISDIRFEQVGNVVLQDTDQDDTVEVIFTLQTPSPTDLFMVGVLNLSAPYDLLSMVWPMFRHDPRRTGRYFRGTIYVDDDNTVGPWYGTKEFPYQYIQDGIDAANPSDEIFVSNGTYNENVVANKPVVLIGEDRDSTVIDAGGAGPGIDITADVVTIRRLTVRNSDESGIHVSSNNNVILRNSIRDNFRGIHVASFESNRIYHNNFMGNTENAYDEGYNIWDNGYPSGGNYWDDYAGGDVYWGPDQDVPGSDGLGDTPYFINGGANQDRYPLISPWTDSLPIPSRDTVYVDDDFDESTPGWGWIRFDKIQDALDTVASGGVVYVANGTYYGEVRMDKTMDLIGEDKDSAVIDGGGREYVVVFNRTQGASLSGFTVRNGVWGVYMGNDTFDNTVFDNIVTDHEQVSIFLSFSRSATISNNVISNAGQKGLHLLATLSSLIVGNTFRGNRFALYSDVDLGDSWIYHNDFLNNVSNACDWEQNIWDNGYPSGGNYWSNFDQASEGAYDNDGDGIVDTLCYVPCGGCQDRYPFINPLHNTLIQGDANKDWVIDIGDVVYLINYLYRGGPSPDSLELADCNCDDIVNVGYVVYLVSYLYRNGPPPGCPKGSVFIPQRPGGSTTLTTSRASD